MAKPNLSRMNVESLLDLRKRIDEALLERRAMLEQQLEQIAGQPVIRGRPRGRGSALKGRKVAPKYRGLSGETWTGRGRQPKWVDVALKEGKKLEDFLIGKSGRKKKRRSKR
jgi:DNA-binding protein H-NS